MQIVDLQPRSPEWHAYRRDKISASTVAAILGESKYSSPLTEWARIVGRVEPQGVASPYADWGLATEHVHRRWFATDHGCKVEDTPYIVQHPTIPWLCCSPDGLVHEDGVGHETLLELKAPSPWTADEWQEKLPLAYQIQLQVQMLCCGLGEAYLSVILPPAKDPTGSAMGLAADLLNGRDVLVALQARGFTRKDWYLEEDPHFQSVMVLKLRTWWIEHVEAMVAPDATGLACDKETLKGLNGVGAVELDFDEAAVAQVDELEQIQAEIKAREAIAERIKNVLTQKAGAETWSEAKKAITKARITKARRMLT